ncbi:hypothetical protein ABLE94_12445 [Gordonia sp. VNK1]|jgi:hypothetical protein|uniref:hypothetical protein n=1 Tax=Gordonia oleivorans TaxID=3156618 RepID=UPI0032B468E5
MSHPIPRRSPRFITARIVVTGLAGIAALSLAACGSDEQSTTTSTVASEPDVTTPSTSVPVVAGPSPRSQSQSSSAETSAAVGGTPCGSVAGPDGSLDVVVLAGDVDCDTAKEIANEYSPKIATGRQQRISAWTCGPSEVRGVLAACQNGDKVIGFMP